MKKKPVLLIYATLFALFLFSCEKDQILVNTSSEPVAGGNLKSSAIRGFKVSGTKLLDAYGNQFIMRGKLPPCLVSTSIYQSPSDYCVNRSKYSENSPLER